MIKNLQFSQKKLGNLCRNQNISYLALFGSQVKDEATKSSDVDLLAEFDEHKSFFELAQIKFKLEDLFKKPVDLVNRKNLKKSLKPYIIQNLVTLYEKR